MGSAWELEEVVENTLSRPEYVENCSISKERL